MSIQQQVQAVRARMAAAAESSGRRPEDIALCAATKVQSDDTIRAAIAAGITLCGENRVQELTAHLAAGGKIGTGAVGNAEVIASGLGCFCGSCYLALSYRKRILPLQDSFYYI